MVIYERCRLSRAALAAVGLIQHYGVHAGRARLFDGSACRSKIGSTQAGEQS